MKLYKIEVLIENSFLDMLVEVIESAGAKGYTTLQVKRGSGIHHGEQSFDGMLPVTHRSLLFSIVDETVEAQLRNDLAPFLKTYGGFLLTYEITFATGLKE